jgi:DNA-binding beta-propeller fold protein YncE
MLKFSRSLLLAASLFTPAMAFAAPPAYRLVQTVPLGGGIKWDYLFLDPTTDLLYVSHGTELTVVKIAAGKIAGHVTGLQGSHGITIDPRTHLGYADSAKTESVSIFDPSSFRTVKTIPALEDADGEVFDPASDQVFIVGGDANAVLAIDATENQTKQTLPLGGAPEFLVVDGTGGLYININDKNQIVKIDTKSDRLTARWNIPGCDGPTGLAIDPAAHRLFSTCENGEMAVLDTVTGKRVALLPIGKGSDSARFDAANRLAFSANRDGSLSIIREVDPGHFVAEAPLRTAPGARTMEIDPKNGDLFLVTAEVLSTLPPTLPGHAQKYVFKPGTLKLLVYQPAASIGDTGRSEP